MNRIIRGLDKNSSVVKNHSWGIYIENGVEFVPVYILYGGFKDYLKTGVWAMYLLFI